MKLKLFITFRCRDTKKTWFPIPRDLTNLERSLTKDIFLLFFPPPSSRPPVYSFNPRLETENGRRSVFCPLCRRGSCGLRVERLPDNRPSRRNSLLGGQGAGGGRGGDVEGDRRRGCRFPGQRSNASGQRGIRPWPQVITRRKKERKKGKKPDISRSSLRI